MALNLTTASIKALGHTASRPFSDHLGDVINVKGMGAIGDGVADDTAAIQAAIDLAFGTAASPHGLDYHLNRPVFFPAGRYLVSPVATTAITAMANVGGRIKLTVASTVGFATGHIVNLYGVVGSPASAYNKTAVGITVDDATHMTLTGSDGSYAASYVSGGSVVGPCVLIRNVQAGWIFGAGRLATKIFSGAAGSCPMTTNGFGYSRVEGIYFQGATNDGGTGFCYNWDGTGLSSQATTFRDCLFGGDYGLDIGAAGSMCSETLILNCHFGATTAGLAVRNYNACQQQVIGGNFQSCAIGIWVAAGSVPIIHGVGFQQQTDADIAVDNSASDGYSISGCRNENTFDGTTFARMHAGPMTHISACTHLASGTGTTFLFAEAGTPPSGTGMFCIDSCYSATGKITGNGKLYIRGNAGGIAFGNASYLSTFAGTVVQNI